MLSSLKQKHDAILALRNTHHDSVLDLQATLHDDVLRSLAEELELDEGVVSRWAEEWIDDYGAVFRMFKKHGFDRAETTAALERTLRWRVGELAPSLLAWEREQEQDFEVEKEVGKQKHPPVRVVASSASTSEQPRPSPSPSSLPSRPRSSRSRPGGFIRCLPDPARDVFGRPVLLVRLEGLLGGDGGGSGSGSGAVSGSAATKREIVYAHEAMRRRLASVTTAVPPVLLQCVMIVDLKDFSVSRQGAALELIPWFVRDVAPRFPGMCAAVFVVNYSWAYGMYNLVKRLLPPNVLARIYFPSESELLSCFDKACLPRDYGGDLDTSKSSPPDWEYRPSAVNFKINVPAGPPSTEPTARLMGQAQSPSLDLRRQPSSNSHLSHHFLHSMSVLNPYFGYPAVATPGSSVPYLKNGRRRKRDLARTLALLWLAKLKKWADNTWMWIVLTLVLWALGHRRVK